MTNILSFEEAKKKKEAIEEAEKLYAKMDEEYLQQQMIDAYFKVDKPDDAC